MYLNPCMASCRPRDCSWLEDQPVECRVFRSGDIEDTILVVLNNSSSVCLSSHSVIFHFSPPPSRHRYAGTTSSFSLAERRDQCDNIGCINHQSIVTAWCTLWLDGVSWGKWDSDVTWRIFLFVAAAYVKVDGGQND